MRCALRDSEHDLVRRAKAGDMAAFDELVREHQQAALRVATIVAGHDRAADAAQEGFIRVYRSMGRFDTDRLFRPWLLRVVANAAKNEVRRSTRHHRVDLKVRAMAVVPDDGADPAIACEDRAQLASALGRLGQGDRLVLALRWFEDLPEAEIATVLGVKPGTVKSRLHRAMRRLRVELENEGFRDE